MATVLVMASALVITGCGASPLSTGTRQASAHRAAGVIFRPIDGGPSYFAKLSPNSAWMDQHILLGAWLELPLTSQDVRNDAAMGDNIYWNLAA